MKKLIKQGLAGTANDRPKGAISRVINGAGRRRREYDKASNKTPEDPPSDLPIWDACTGPQGACRRSIREL